MTTKTYGQHMLGRLMESTDPTISRRVTEAPASPQDREDGLIDGFNIPLDAQTRALASRVKMPLARRIVALLSMSGIPGRYLASEDVEGGVMNATDMLRKKASVRKAFIDFYSALATSKGYATPDDKAPAPKDDVQEAIGDGEEQKKGNYIHKLFTTVLIELGMPAHLAGVTAPSIVAQGLLKTAQSIEEDGSLERALRMLALRMGIKADEVRSGVQNEQVTEEDESDDSLLRRYFANKGKQRDTGSSIKGSYGHGEVRKKRADLDEDFEARPGFYVVKRHGSEEPINVEGPFKYEQQAHDRAEDLGGEEHGFHVMYRGEKDISTDDGRYVGEAFDPGQDEFMGEVVRLVEALGIPGDVLERRKPQVIKALRERKLELKNRASILTNMRRLMSIIDNNKVAPGQGDAE